MKVRFVAGLLQQTMLDLINWQLSVEIGALQGIFN